MLECGLKYAEEKCIELEINAEPQKRIRRKKRMPGEGATDALLSY